MNPTEQQVLRLTSLRRVELVPTACWSAPGLCLVVCNSVSVQTGMSAVPLVGSLCLSAGHNCTRGANEWLAITESGQLVLSCVDELNHECTRTSRACVSPI